MADDMNNMEDRAFELLYNWIYGDKYERKDVLDAIPALKESDYKTLRDHIAEKLDWTPARLDKYREKRLEKGGQPESIFRKVEAWPDPVDGEKLLNSIKATFLKHVVISDESAVACSLWVLHTYAFDAATASPILAITSPEKRCGKTTLLGLLDALSFRAIAVSLISTAAIYRIVENFRPALIIDEADTFMSGNETLRGVLNSGHTKTTARIIKCDGDNFQPKTFSTWAPKAIACIGDLPETIRDRSIEIIMKRKKNTDTIERFREKDREGVNDLCRKARRWAEDNMDTLKKMEPEIVHSLSDREMDSWEPLLAIADITGEKWSLEARIAANRIACTEAKPSVQTQLLFDIRGIFESLAGETKIKSQELVEKLILMEESPWSSYSSGRGLTTRDMAQLLKSYGIRSQDIRFTDGTRKGYFVKSFDDAFNRYLPAESATSAT